MPNWNPEETSYSKILTNIFQNISSGYMQDTNRHAYDQNGNFMYADPNPPAPLGTIDLTFQEIKEDKLPES